MTFNNIIKSSGPTTVPGILHSLFLLIFSTTIS
jgi:hypothetical protein